MEKNLIEEIRPPLKVKPVGEVDSHMINAIVTIGGDGTILWSSRYFKYGYMPPIIAFAMGTLNYMCNFSVSDYETVLKKGLNLDQGDMSKYPYELEVKSRIECSVFFNF